MKTKMSGAAKGHAFTLLELLVVIVIVGIIAGMALPVLNQFKPNYTASAARTLLDELARARQLAISQRTTVYMVFVPTNLWTDVAYARLPPSETAKAVRLYDKQLIGYAFVSLRSIGDQIGRPTVRYLTQWKTLPEGAFIATQKFGPNNQVLTNLHQRAARVPDYGVQQDRLGTVPIHGSGSLCLRTPAVLNLYDMEHRFCVRRLL